MVIYRDLSLTRDVPRVMTECGLLVGGIILILGMALGFTNYLIDAEIPDQATEWVRATITSPVTFLLALNLLLLLVGAFMDIYSAIIVVTGWPVLKDLPRSPVTALCINDTYCPSSGWSSPRLLRNSSTSCGAAPSPSMACAGSPGTR